MSLTILLLISLYLRSSIAEELRQDDQQLENLESALSDTGAASADKLSAIELEENMSSQPQTEWRSKISSEASEAFSAAVAAQRGIKEVLPLFPCQHLNLQLTPSISTQGSQSDAAAVAAFNLLSAAASLNHPGAQRELGLAFKYDYVHPELAVL
jgi:hypothetical protein